MEPRDNNANPRNETGERYPYHIKSGLAAVRRELKKLGVPLGKVEGRYQPFCNAQKIIPGIKAHQVGCSRTIGVHFLTTNWMESDAQREECKATLKTVLDALRSKGFPFNEKGYMDCEYYK